MLLQILQGYFVGIYNLRIAITYCYTIIITIIIIIIVIIVIIIIITIIIIINNLSDVLSRYLCI